MSEQRGPSSSCDADPHVGCGCDLDPKMRPVMSDNARPSLRGIDPADYTGTVGITEVRPKLVVDYADPKVKIALAALVRSDPTYIDVWGSELTIGTGPDGVARYRVVGYDPETHCLLADLIDKGS